MEGQINFKIKDLENRYQQYSQNFKNDKQNLVDHQNLDEQKQHEKLKEIQQNQFGQNQIIWEPQLNYEKDQNSNSAYKSNKQSNQQSINRPSFYEKTEKYKLKQFSPTLNYPQHINQGLENGNPLSSFNSNRHPDDLKKYFVKNTINSNSSANIDRGDKTGAQEIQSDITDAAQDYGQIKLNNFVNRINEVSLLNESSQQVLNAETVHDNIQYQTQTNFDKNIFQNSSTLPSRQQYFEKSPDLKVAPNCNQNEHSQHKQEQQSTQKSVKFDNDAIRK